MADALLDHGRTTPVERYLPETLSRNEADPGTIRGKEGIPGALGAGKELGLEIVECPNVQMRRATIRARINQTAPVGREREDASRGPPQIHGTVPGREGETNQRRLWHRNEPRQQHGEKHGRHRDHEVPENPATLRLCWSGRIAGMRSRGLFELDPNVGHVPEAAARLLAETPQDQLPNGCR